MSEMAHKVQAQKMHIHLIGIGGSGLSAIARLLLERGHTVTGSDRALSPLAQDLVAAGAGVFLGHKAENVRGANLVIRSSAVPDDNVEVLAAQAAGIPMMKRANFLGQLMANHQSIAIAGTHGKTTITAMIAWLLVQLGEDPSYIIGGTARNLGRNAHAGKGQAFVIEADEYDRMFLGLQPDLAIVSYLEHDHPDCYPTPLDYRQAFVDFIQGLRPGGTLLVSHDNLEARQLARVIPSGCQSLTYGTNPEADYTAANLVHNQQGGYDFEAFFCQECDQPQRLALVSLQVPGEHNVRNALAALAAVHQLLPQEHRPQGMSIAAQALSEYIGAGRRFDVRGVVDGVTVIDDYAHHPTEVQATLAAARARYPQQRIWAVWQPHTYSRTRALLPQFIRSFDNAERVLVTEIYAAREQAEQFDHFSAAQVVQQINHPGVQFVPTLEDATSVLLASLQPGDVLLILSAGDADQVSVNVLAHLQERHQAAR